MKKFRLTFCFLLLVSGNLFSVETVPYQKIKTGVYISPPFVMKDSAGYYTGMAIDLWELVEDDVNIKTEYIEFDSWNQLMQSLLNDEINIAISNISVTYERAQLLKYSFPWYDAGLRIMVKGENSRSIWNELKRNGHLNAYIGILLIIILLTIILTIIHRKKDPKFPHGWIDGLAESLYRLILAIKTGVVNNANYNWIGKVLAVTWMLCGIGLVAYVTSSITSSMTAVAFKYDIHSLNDLPGKKVGVLTGSVAEQYLRGRGIETIMYENTGEVTQALIDDKVQAIVDDAPILEYWTFNNPERGMKVVGNLFHPDKYAFIANKNHSALMDSLSVSLIRLFDSGKTGDIKNSYFGNIH